MSDEREQSDLQLCARVRSESSDSTAGRAAYAELYRRYHDATMLRALQQVDYDRSRAEDLVSEAFAKTLRALDRGLGPTESVAAYLFTAVRSEARRPSKMEHATDFLEPERLENLAEVLSPIAADDASELDSLAIAFSSLPEPWQRIVLLVDVNGMTVAQASERIALSAAAATSMLFRAREALRTAFLQQYVEQADATCRETAKHLAAYVRGGLRHRATRRVEDHIAQCPRCSDERSRLARLNESLRAWIGPGIAGGGVAGLMSVLGAGSEPSAAAVASTTSTHRGLGWWVSGTAAAAIVAVIFMMLPWSRSPPRPAGQDAQHDEISAVVDGRDAGDRRASPEPIATPSPAVPPPAVPEPTLVERESDATPRWVVIRNDAVPDS